MIYLNEFMAALAIPVLVLTFRGFWPHLLRNMRDWSHPQAWLMLMIVILDAKGIVRMAWWDGVRPALLGAEMIGGASALEVAFVNAGLNTMALVGALCGMKALHLTIPEDHEDPALRREAWSQWTAWAYPARCRVWRK